MKHVAPLLFALLVCLIFALVGGMVYSTIYGNPVVIGLISGAGGALGGIVYQYAKRNISKECGEN